MVLPFREVKPSSIFNALNGSRPAALAVYAASFHEQATGTCVAWESAVFALSSLGSSGRTVSPDTPLAHGVKGFLLRAQERWADAIPEYEAVIALNRNSPDAYHSLAQCKLFTGSFEEVVPLVEQAIRLSPRDPALGIWYLVIGRTHLLQSRTDEAIVWLEKARSANPAHPTIHGLLAPAYGTKGEIERAADELAAARRLSADDRYSSIARMRAIGTFGVPKVRALSKPLSSPDCARQECRRSECREVAATTRPGSHTTKPEPSYASFDFIDVSG